MIWLVMTMAFFTATTTYASEWDLRKDKSDIQVFTKKVEHSDHFSFKGTSRITTNIQSLVNLMRDMSVMDQWLATCREPVIIEEPDTVSRLIHMKNDSPFSLAISDRDIVLIQRFRRESPEVVIVDLEDKHDHIEPIDGHVRGVFNGHWKFTRISETETDVEYYGLVDPAGSVPAWMSNIAVIDTPFNTLKSIRKILHSKSTQYDVAMAMQL